MHPHFYTQVEWLLISYSTRNSTVIIEVLWPRLYHTYKSNRAGLNVKMLPLLSFRINIKAILQID
ncbi:hypothetical protein D3C73_197210 [compost metagenome]|nr:Uncharacterised protein [Serratia fonticola]